ncbi:MAG: AsmA-like C-terminal region-containing protein [Halioglobus sp.]|jgi:hypothetical protein
MRKSVIAISLLGVTLVALAMALRSQAVVLATAHWLIGQFTDLRLELADPQIDLYDGLLSARELHLVPVNTAGPPLITVLDLSVTTRLSDLISSDLGHTSITATQLIIYVSTKDSAEDPAPVQWLQYLAWLPRHLRVDQVHLITDAAETLILPLKELLGERFGNRSYHLTADADYSGEPLQAVLDLLAVREAQQLRGVSLKARFEAPESGSEVALDGELLGTQDDFNYDFQLDANYRDVSAFLKGFDVDRNIRGQLKMAARVEGNTAGFTLSDARFSLDNMPDYGFEATGRLEYNGPGDTRLELAAAGELSTLHYLVGWLGPGVDHLGRAQANLSISGSLEQPVVDNLILHTSSSDGLIVDVSGRRQSSVEGEDMSQAENEIQIDVHGPSLQVLERWLGPLRVDPGPWFASARLTGNRNRIAVRDLVMESGTKETALLHIEGSIGDVTNVSERGLTAAENIQLDLVADIADSNALSALLEREIAPGYRIEAGMHLAGDGRELRGTEGRAEVNGSALGASLSSVQLVIHPGAESSLQDLTGRIRVNVPDTGALAQFTDARIPSLGAVHVEGNLSLRGETLQLTDVEGVLESDRARAKASGHVDNLVDLAGIALNLEFSGVDTRNLIQNLLPEFQYPGSVGSLNGSFTFSNSAGAWRVSDVKVAGGEEGGALEFAAAGELERPLDTGGSTTAALKANYRVRDPALLEALTGLRMNPAAGTVTLATRPGALAIESRSRVGETQLAADGWLGYEGNQVNSLRLAVNVPHLYLGDLGLQAEQAGTTAYKPVERLEEVESRNRLAGLLRRSPRYDTDITVDLNGITGKNTNINSVNIHATGENNRYILRRFSVTYAQADAEIRGIIDLNPAQPAISLAGQALSIPMNTLAADLGADVDIKGILSLRGGISASGTTGTELLSTLDGSVAIALEDAVIEGAAYDILATDLLEWIYSGAMLEKYTDIDCTMAKFQLDDGVATSDSLFVETGKMLATGTGTFDLVRKTMDMTITPMSKSRMLQVPSSVRLKGDFGNPRPIISPITAAADAYTRVLTLVPQMVFKLFGQTPDKKKKRMQPCEPGLD